MIVEAQYTDLKKILTLQKECYQQEAQIYNDFEIPPLTQTLASIEDDFKEQLFLKAEVNKKIIGAVRAYEENGTCKIGRLIVDKDFQNQGWGRLLMKAVEDKYPKTERFQLFTGHKSVKNLSLYHKLGYKACKRQRVNSNLTLIFLEKPHHKD